MLIYLIRLFINLIRAELAIKTQIAKLKMTKHQRQNIPMKVIQKTQKQTKHLQLPNILLDAEIADGMNSLNSKQRKVFTVVHTWAKE